MIKIIKKMYTVYINSIYKVENVGNTENLGKLLKETRLSKGITIEYLFMKTRIPKDIIKRIENEPDFLEQNPYARIFFKQLCKELNINIKQLEEKKETLAEKIKKLEEQPLEEQKSKDETLTFSKKVVNTAASLSILFSLVLLSMSFKEKSSEDPFKIFVESKAVENPEKIEKQESKKQIKKQESFLGNTVLLKAEATVWITAVVDGKNRVITLKKGEKRLIPFDSKIVFETIGNSKNLVINYNDKEIIIPKEIVHNVFVDKEGIFFNGENLLGDVKNSWYLQKNRFKKPLKKLVNT